ncbi:DEAD/DEAH box helicase [uncultured Bacteroides sp.]|uniref:DEAD/DEAH box helicase n=1 Tax=uncultured Bacteroides sp. TaxID=162156 RepID=UPI00266E99DD|nr:DEAD/DEAH box helicase [uncultured Bacteroides sp.]
MIQAPRNATLAEALYRNIDKNEYLQEIYGDLLYNYSIKLFHTDRRPRDIPVKDALRFADLLSKSAHTPTADRDRLWGQEIAILLRLLYPEDASAKYYLGSVLSAVGNYRGLRAKTVEGFESENLLDQIFYEYDKEEHRIPGKNDEYFFNDQMLVYKGMKEKFFSYSGPTSMGKSFVVQAYIQQEIENGSTDNFAILVPTKALINEVRSNLIGALQSKLKELNYRIVTASGDLVLQQDHHFIFVMTPERLLHMMIERENIHIDFLFIDEAHKISARGGRSTYYFKVLTQLGRQKTLPTVIFASPNIPNPEVYMNIIPGIEKADMKKLASRFAPVCQFKYFLNVPGRGGYYYNDYSKQFERCYTIPEGQELCDIVATVGQDKQNVVYCSSRRSVLEQAVKYARNIHPKNDESLNALATEIRQEVHDDCYLADLIVRGVAYHVGYLPANIRLRIEKSFEKGDLRTIFCTSTLIEGVNLPADNLFITSYRNGQSNMDEVEFRNLVGRVGRIKYNLYGNVILVKLDEKLKEERYKELLQTDVPPQESALDIKQNTDYMGALVRDLADGDIEMSTCHDAATETDFEALRKFGLILTRDLASGKVMPVTQKFENFLSNRQKQRIIENFPIQRTSDDITLSYDQAENLHDAIVNEGLHYPELKGEDDEVDFEELVEFMMKLRRLFKWDIYEKQTLGKPGTNRLDSVIRWYSTILLRWIRGNGLRTIILSAIRYKENNPETGVWSGQYKVADRYNSESKYHKNLVIAESLSVIENVLLFSISNYFRKVSLEYKAVHGMDHFENDWYEFVEYGTTNPDTIFLQQSGFSREASIFIQKPSNYSKYILEVDGKKRIKRSILECGNIGVETEATDIQFNIPELFID